MRRRTTIIVLGLIFFVTAVSIAALLLIPIINKSLGHPREYWVARHMKQLVWLIHLYHGEHMSLPTEANWINELEVYPESEPSMFVDNWGNQIIYVIQSEEPKFDFRLYSVGKNGIDEQMSGDDVVVSTNGEWLQSHENVVN